MDEMGIRNGGNLMYDEFVKRMCECASGECFNCSQYTPTTNASVCQKELMKQAADAIEELTGFVQEAERDRDEYRERLDKANDAIEELQKRIPKSPHGRLIDADALIKSLSLDEDDVENGASLLMAIFIEVLKAAPTIIPLDKESGE